MLMRQIRARRSASICGRPPRGFQRQYLRKPARCQRTRVSGRTTVMALRTDGPTVQLDEEQAIAVGELDPTAHLALQR